MVSIKNLNLTEVKRFAQSLGEACKSGNFVIGFVGPLGAGKTTFIKSFAKSFGIKKIKSPSFLVMNTHKRGKRKFYHLDFYRLKNIHELEHLGIWEILNEQNRTVVVEWVDILPKMKKYCNFIIKLQIEKNNRRDVTII